jgi:hypothetical protein
LNFGSFIVSLSVAVLLEFTFPTWALTSTSFVSYGFCQLPCCLYIDECF